MDEWLLEIKPFSLIERRLSRQQMETHLAIMGWAPMICTSHRSGEQLPALAIGGVNDYRTCRYQRFTDQANPTLQTRLPSAWVETAWHQFDNRVFWDCVKKMVAAGWLTLPL